MAAVRHGSTAATATAAAACLSSTWGSEGTHTQVWRCRATANHSWRVKEPLSTALKDAWGCPPVLNILRIQDSISPLNKFSIHIYPLSLPCCPAIPWSTYTLWRDYNTPSATVTPSQQHEHTQHKVQESKLSHPGSTLPSPWRELTGADASRAEAEGRAWPKLTLTHKWLIRENLLSQVTVIWANNIKFWLEHNFWDKSVEILG